MAKNWQYPRWRRYVMQAVMWLILAGAIAAAALVDHSLHQATQVKLGGAIHAGGLTFRLPADWNAKKTADLAWPVLARAVDSKSQRELLVCRQSMMELASPQEYLIENGLIVPDLVAVGAGGVKIGGRQMTRVEAAAIVNGLPEWEIALCKILPSRQAVTVVLRCQGRLESSDLGLLQQVAGSLADSSFPSFPPPGGTVRLMGGASVDLPPDAIQLVESDPNLTARQVLLNDSPADWLSMTLVPCVMPGPMTQQGLITQISTLPEEWDGATAVEQSPRHWRIDLPAQPAEMFLVRGYAVFDDQGRGVIAVFHAAPRSVDAVERVWLNLQDGIHLGQETDVAAMLAAGSAEARRLGGLGLNRLLGSGSQERWWRWSQSDPPQPLGGSHLKFTPTSSGGWTGTMNLRVHLIRGQDALLWLGEDWSGSTSLQSYDYQLGRCEVVRQERVGFPALKTIQSTDLKPDRLLIRKFGVSDSESVGTPPPQFVPGAWLQLLLGRLSDRPMILRTDTFPNYEGNALDPLTLLVRPLPPGAGGTRSLQVEVSGSGEISRWDFTPDGDLLAAQFGWGLRLDRGDVGSLRKEFADDPRLIPP